MPLKSSSAYNVCRKCNLKPHYCSVKAAISISLHFTQLLPFSFIFPHYFANSFLCRSNSVKDQNLLEMHTQSCIPTTYLTCKDLDLHRHWRTHTLTPFTAGKHHPLLGFPHHSLPFSSCDLIGCCMGEAHCRGRNQGEGGFPRLARLIHTKPTTYTCALIHTYRESLLFSFKRMSRFWLQSAGKLFTSSAGFKVLPSR